MLKAVIFDLDDTLCNTSEVIDEALKITFKDHLNFFPEKTIEQMLEINKESFYQVFHNPKIPIPSATILIWFKTFELLGIRPPLKAIISLIEQAREEIRKKIKPLPGAIELIDYLQNNNIKIGVLSNGAFMEQAKKIFTIGIEDKIEYLVTPDICLADKPDQVAFNYILEKLGTQPENTTMIGDTVEIDIFGAKKIGMKSILVGRSFRSHENNIKADFHIGNNLLDAKIFLDF